MRRALCSCLTALTLTALAPAQEPPSWDQLDARLLPQWFADAKFGIFIHWGVYSVPAFCDTSTYSEWYQHWLDTKSHNGLVADFHSRVYGDRPYRAFAEQFRCELWDPAQWAATFRRAGADYIVLTSKHHDGFALWPDQHSERVRGHTWNAGATGPKRDLVGELATAVRREGIRFGLYYSFLEWHNPLFERSIPDYVDQQMLPQVHDLIARYQPDVFWPDGEWEHPSTTWRSRELLQWLRTNAPNRDELVVNDRWGKECRGEHGDFYTTEYGAYGGSKTYGGDKPFEECRGIGHSFAWNRAEGYDIYLSRTECVRTLIDLVSRGGKLLLDIGPAADGTIPLIMVDRLFAIGDWLADNGDSIRGCARSPFRNTPWGRATQKGSTLYLHVFDWPADGKLVVRGLQSRVLTAYLLREPAARLAAGTTNSMLGSTLAAGLPVHREPDGALVIDLRGRHPSEHATVVAVQVEGAPRVQDAWLADARGALVLPARGAATAGAAMQHDAHGDLVGWSAAGDVAIWDAVQLQPGVDYEVQVECAFAPKFDEREVAFELAVGEAVQTAMLRADPSNTSAFGRTSFATIRAADKEPVTVSLRLPAARAQAFGAVRTLHLVPTSGFAAGAPMLQLLGAGMVNQLSAQLLQRAQQGDATRDGAAGLAGTMYAADAVLTPPGGKPIVGREAITAWLLEQAERLRGVRQLTTEVRVARDNCMVQFGRYAIDDAGAAPADAWTGEFVRVWGPGMQATGIVSETWWK